MPVISIKPQHSIAIAPSSIMRALLVSLALLFGSCLSHAQQRTPKPMSMDEAKQFALAAIAPKLKRLPAFGLKPPEKTASGLYVFNATWEGLPNGSVEIGFYAVDPITGTVWDAVMECQQIATPQFRDLQQKRQKQLGLTAPQLQKFQAKGPQCS